MDQQKYINTYIDKSVGMLHEYISMVLQLRTQLELANNLIIEKDKAIDDLVQQKDQVISTLQTENEQQKTDSSELQRTRDQAKIWEESYNAMKVKIGHMDTLTGQLNETKNLLIAKTQEVDALNNRINELNKSIEELRNPPPKKVINTKKEKTTKTSPEIITETTDDF